jgi:hypothetical protein
MAGSYIKYSQGIEIFALRMYFYLPETAIRKKWWELGSGGKQTVRINFDIFLFMVVPGQGKMR